MANTITVKSQSYEGRYMYVTCTQTKDIATNTSTIDWKLTVTGGNVSYYTTGPTTVVINGQQVYYKAKTQWDSYAFPAAKGSVSGKITVPHDDYGNKTIAVSVTTNIYTGVLQTKSADWTLDKIDRLATLTAAPDFTDEQNPTITYSNPAGTKVEKLQACISLDGSAADIAYRDIPKDGTSYTFALTGAEKQVLYKATTGGTSRTVYFFVKTTIGGSDYTSNLKKTFTVVNSAPTLSVLVMDSNEKTVALTGDRMAYLVKGYSDAAYEMSARALKYASITAYSATTTGASKTTASGTFSKVQSGAFKFSTTDNRNLKTQKSITLNLIDYFKPTCIVDVSMELDTDTSVRATVKISGNFFNGSFGATNNSLDIQIKHSAAADWLSLKNDLGVNYTTKGNTYSAQFSVSNLDYKEPFSYQVKVIDKLETISTEEKTISYLPVFDWGADDFNFNVNVNMHGDTVVRHTTGDIKSTVLSAQGGSIYLRPNGTGAEGGQLRILADGRAFLNNSRILTTDVLYPIGAIYISLNETSPTTLFGGTWTRIGGRFLLAANSTYEAGSTGGAATHTLTVDEMPKHSHDMPFSGSTSGTQSPYPYYIKSASTLNDTGGKGYRNNLGTFEIGGGAAHNNMPPYLAVYMWKRTA